MGLMCRDPARRLSGRDALSRLGAGPVVRDSAGAWRSRSRTPRSSAAGVSSRCSTTPTRRSHAAAAARVCVRPVGHRQECPGAVLSRAPQGRGRRRRARRALLRTRVRALQGTRRSGRQPVALHGVAVAGGGRARLAADVVALPRVFPVMLRVPAIARACREREPAVSEPFGVETSRVRRAARAAGSHCRSPASGDLHRRPAVDGPRRRAAARGAAAAAGRSSACSPWSRSEVRRSPPSRFFESCSKAASTGCGRPSTSSQCPTRKPARSSARCSQPIHRSPTTRERRSPAKRRVVRLCWSSWPAAHAWSGWSRARARRLPRCSTCAWLRSHPRRAASSRRWRSAADRWSPSWSARRAASRGARQSLVAMLRSALLHPQQRVVGAGRDLSRSDSRGAGRGDPRR